MKLRSVSALALLLALCVRPFPAHAGFTTYFSPGLIAVTEEVGPDFDTISSQGFRFTYTRDKFFTGGYSEPIGRPVRVSWPDGIEAQYVTSGPNPRKAEILVRRVDGQVFDLNAFTVRLLANAGAGRAIEIVPLLNGEEPLNDPIQFDVSGNYWQTFSYDTSPNPNGSTAPLVGYDAYKMKLTLDFAVIGLTLFDQYAATAVDPLSAPDLTSELQASPNPAGDRLQFRLSGDKAAADACVSVYSLTGRRLRTLALDAAGQAAWDLCDDAGRPVAAGVYYARTGARPEAAAGVRVVVVR
ncbi:MAG TPA: hypothetical protein P5571_15115 [Candidatus Krumholzibacteria bacterium]|nr:hypothetical protein [Candidatus Krumholzibacteria bacterium]HRX52698.1 hypothetical protein [Candidatus Krumholzibacteria bacterium]